MEDDNEVLDWGHEEEPAVAVHGAARRMLDVDDAEDAVSLGGDEEDEFLAYQSRAPQDAAQRTPSSKQDSPMGPRDSLQPEQLAEHTGSADQPSLPIRPLVHALPPKPVLSTVPFVHPSHPSIIEATAMASRAERDKRNGVAVPKASAYDPNDALPPGWEVKYPRNGRGVYYYNIYTQESTWTRPTVSSSRDRRGERSERRDDPLDKPLPTRNGEARVGRSDNGDMSYDDRHYRPGESARREERPTRSSQLMDSYVPDSCSPDHKNSRPSSPSPRARERDPTPPPRRHPSPHGSYGDRDAGKSSYHETPTVVPSAQDRVRDAHDDVPRERTRERRQRDDLPPSQTERRNLPRDTERSSTRPRSPASYTRGSQESANTTPRSSIKPPQPVSEAPAPARKSRFSQADASIQHSHRPPDSRDVGLRRARTDVSRTRYTDDLPSSRSMSDIRGNDDPPTYPASDAQRLGSRRRSPLPPKDEVFFPGARSAAAPRGANYFSEPAGPTLVPENRRISRTIPDDPPRDSSRRSPSPLPPPPPQPRLPPAERGGYDRVRSRWSKPQPSGLLQVDSRNAHELPKGRARDIAMDLDDPPPRSSDQSTKQVPPRRPVLQDDVPRYPRAMLNSDNDGPPRGGRETRDGTDSRHRPAVDGSSRFGPPRERLGTERHSADQSNSQKEPYRGVDTRPSPPGFNVKLSGTNNTPIGARTQFASSVPHPPTPPGSTYRTPAAPSGNNGELVAPRRDRVNKDYERASSRVDGAACDRNVPMEPTRREDPHRSPPINARALPPEPVALSSRPSRAALGISRFGPPIIKEPTEPVQVEMNVSSESQHSEPIPEESLRATPPPSSRESSMVSLKDVVVLPNRPSHLPPKPASPIRGYRFRSGDANNQFQRPSAQSPTADSRHNEMDAGGPACPTPPSPAARKRIMDTYPSEPSPVPRDNRTPYSPERPRANFRGSEADHSASRPPPPPPVVQSEDLVRAPPAMHPERALLFQVNGLPPRPLSALGPARSGRGFKRERRDEGDQERAEPLRGINRGRRTSPSPRGERRRYPEDDRSVGYASGGGPSLLDRLMLDEEPPTNLPSLRERVELPFKRDREEMLGGELSFEPDGGDEYDGLKRVRRRATRIRKSRG